MIKVFHISQKFTICSVFHFKIFCELKLIKWCSLDMTNVTSLQFFIQNFDRKSGCSLFINTCTLKTWIYRNKCIFCILLLLFYSHFESTMNCVRSTMFGCAKEIKMEVRSATEEGFCIASDILKSCDILEMEEPKMDLPSCMNDKQKMSCNMTAAYGCLKHLYWELENPFVDCNTMHE